MLCRSIRLEPLGHPRLAGRRLLAAAAFLAAVSICRPGEAQPLSYARRGAAGLALHVIDVNLNDPRVVVSPAMAASGRGRCERFSHFVDRLKPAAAINGTYFSRRTLLPVGDVVAGGKVLHFGGMGTALAFAGDGVDVVRLPKSRRVDWSEHSTAIAGGPLLVWDGFPKPKPGGEGFGDPHVFSRSAPRTAIGVTKYSHLLLVTTVGGCSLARLAKAMRELGAVYAVNLDGGSSCGMYYRGQMIRGAKRALTNVLAVHVKTEARDREPLREPRGLDWRNGHGARPGVGFWAKGTRFWVRLPRRWEAKSDLYLKATRPLPPGWALRVQVDQKTVETVGELPAVVVLDLKELDPLKEHEWRVNAADADGKIAGHTERIFRMGQAGRGRR